MIYTYITMKYILTHTCAVDEDYFTCNNVMGVDLSRYLLVPPSNSFRIDLDERPFRTKFSSWHIFLVLYNTCDGFPIAVAVAPCTVAESFQFLLEPETNFRR